MSDCLKCSYPKDQPKGSRVCKKCGRVEGEPKRGPGNFVRLEKQPAPTGDPFLDQTGDAIPIYERHIHVGGETYCTDECVDRAIANSPPYACPDLDQDGLSDEPLPPPLPAHSKMGGSRAHQFLNCPGSTALIAGLKIEGGEEDDPDYRRDGTQAHALAARCLEADYDAWELIGEYPQLNPYDAVAVQVYLNYVRSLPGLRQVEIKLHLPELHPAMFSTLDAVVQGQGDFGVLHIVDYKHGEGVFVEVENNEQLMYYACMAIVSGVDYEDSHIVEMTIVQPRIHWAEPVRSWCSTVGELKEWLYNVLLPAMRLEAQELHLQMGEWCRFCPVKLVCPPHRQAFDAFAGASTELAELSDEVLGRDYVLTETVMMRCRGIKAEVERRAVHQGKDIPGAKVVKMRSDRVWKDGTEEFLRNEWGDEAFPPKMISPAQAEKMPGGKVFVSEFAYAPDKGYTVALLSSPAKAVKPETAEDKYGDPSKYVVDSAGESVV